MFPIAHASIVRGLHDIDEINYTQWRTIPSEYILISTLSPL